MASNESSTPDELGRGLGDAPKGLGEAAKDVESQATNRVEGEPAQQLPIHGVASREADVDHLEQVDSQNANLGTADLGNADFGNAEYLQGAKAPPQRGNGVGQLHGNSGSGGSVGGTRTVEWERRPHRYAKALPLGLAVAGLVGLAALHNTVTKGNVEGDLQAKAVAQLSKEFPGLGISFDGRDATISGSSADPTAIQRAHDLVRNIKGVRHVRDPKTTFASAAVSTTADDTSVSIGADVTDSLPAPTTPATKVVTATKPLPTTIATSAATSAPTTTVALTSTIAPTTIAVATTTVVDVPVDPVPVEVTPESVEVTPDTAVVDAPAISTEAPDFSGRLLFNTGSPTVNQEGNTGIDELANYLNDNPDVQIGLSGHTDSIGTRLTNLAISKARADGVRAQLVARGIDASRIKAFGYGARLPVGDNATASGRQTNRRVDVQFFGTGPGQDVSFTG